MSNQGRTNVDFLYWCNLDYVNKLTSSGWPNLLVCGALLCSTLASARILMPGSSAVMGTVGNPCWLHDWYEVLSWCLPLHGSMSDYLHKLWILCQSIARVTIPPCWWTSRDTRNAQETLVLCFDSNLCHWWIAWPPIIFFTDIASSPPLLNLSACVLKEQTFCQVGHFAYSLALQTTL